MEEGPVQASFVLSKNMAVKKTIAIIGATEEQGKALSIKLAQGPYRLLLFGKNRKETDILVKEMEELFPLADVEGRDCLVEASWEADIIIPITCIGSEKEIVEKIRPVATRKIIINFFNLQEQNTTSLEGEAATVEELKREWPYSNLVRIEKRQKEQGFIDFPTDVFLASEDEDTLETVLELTRIMGFRPVINNCIKT